MILTAAVREHDNNNNNQLSNTKFISSKSKFGITLKNPEKVHKNESPKSIQRHVKKIDAYFKNQQSQFNDNIDIEDEWISHKQRKNPEIFQKNKRLSKQWKQNFDEKQREQFKKLRNNQQRITNMTFTAHLRRFSTRDMLEQRVSVCIDYI